MVRKSISQYKKMTVSGMTEANPYKLTAAMFQQILGNIAAAKGAMEQKEHEAKGGLISNTITLLGVLEGALDYEQGGEIADNLGALYQYSISQLSIASAKNDPEILEEVLKLLLPIKSAWDAIPPEEQEKSFFAESQDK